MYILGIDGGGTHTRAELRDGENRFLRRGEFGPFNMAAIGEAAFRQRIREILHWAGGEIAALCIGGAGSSGGAMAEVLGQELEDAGFRGSLKLCGDHEIALAGAFPDAGVVLIAGTGSICCGKNASGETARCGGWGHLLDDGGSAYAIGSAALSAALRTEDGRLQPNALHPAVMEALSAEKPGDIVRFAYYDNPGKAAIAALAPVVLDCAQAGDTVSMEILEKQAAELAELVRAVSRRLKLERPQLALLGGMLEHDSIYSRLVRNSIAGIAVPTLPAHDPVWGAAELAWECRKTFPLER